MYNEDDLDFEQQPVALRTLAKATQPRRAASPPNSMEPLNSGGDARTRAPPLGLSDVDEEYLLFEKGSSKSSNALTQTPTPRASKFVHFNVNEVLTPTTPEVGVSGIASPSSQETLSREALSISTLPTSEAVLVSAVNDEHAPKPETKPADKVSSSTAGGAGGSNPMMTTNSHAGAAAQSGKGEGGEELVEIKPRRRGKRGGEARRVNANPSAFDGVPPAETYDPAWNTAPLRVEGGQLRDRRDGNKPRAPLLPSAFRGVSSGSSSSGSSSDTERTAGVRAALSGLSFRRRATSEGGRWALEMKGKRNVVEMGSCAAVALRLLDAILRCDFGADIVALKALEMRARVPIAGARGTAATPRLIVITAVGNWAEGCRLVFRRSLTDATRMDPDAFLDWVDGVRSRLTKVDPTHGNPPTSS